MTIGAWLLVLAVITLAAAIWAHVALWARLLDVTEITRRQRWIALVPPMPAWFGWHHGKRKHAAAYVVLVLVYAGLRAALALR